MKILLDIRDDKATFFMEWLRSSKFVKKAVPVSEEKAQLIADIKEAVVEMNLIKAGKLKARNAEEIINEL